MVSYIRNYFKKAKQKLNEIVYELKRNTIREDFDAVLEENQEEVRAGCPIMIRKYSLENKLGEN